MKYVVYRPVGNVRCHDEDGKEVMGYKTIEPVFEVEAPSAQAAIIKARSLKDPAPIVQEVTNG